LYNEPHYKSQGNMSPAEAAEFAMQHQDWNGPIYCCGVFYNDNGWAWFQKFIELYDGRLDGIHLHVYMASWSDDNNLYEWGRRWREVADQNGWDIIISEWSSPGNSQKETIERNKNTLPAIQNVFRPSAMFYFSWNYGWINSDLSDNDGSLTPVGDWFFETRSTMPVMWLARVSS